MVRFGGGGRALPRGKRTEFWPRITRIDTDAARHYRWEMKRGLTWVSFFLAVAVWAGAAEKPPFPHARLGVANGCFVESVALVDAWQATVGAETWVKLLRWGAMEEAEVVAGHAVAVGEVRGKLWCWDVNFGWNALPIETAQRDAAEVVAGPVVARYAKVKAQFPLYMADFPQAAGAAGAQSSSANEAIRDASIAGERLARRRPVNVVVFTQGTGESARENAAAVFVFGGRYCVYVPEVGTVPFRVQGGVENLRLIQQLLRRMVGDVGVVRKV